MISFVVPVHNEGESLATLHEELSQVVESKALGDVEFLFIDDGSRDNTWDVILKLSGVDPRVHAIRFRRNFGKAAALTAGFEAARGEIVFTLDGDLQDDPAEVPRFLESSTRALMSSVAGSGVVMILGTRWGQVAFSMRWSVR